MVDINDNSEEGVTNGLGKKVIPVVKHEFVLYSFDVFFFIGEQHLVFLFDTS